MNPSGDSTTILAEEWMRGLYSNSLISWHYVHIKNMNNKKKKTHTHKLSFFLTKRLFFSF